MNPGDVIGGFRISEKIGSGGMATVYKAVQLSLDRVVVLKILHAHLAEDESLVARFDGEAKKAAYLRHENIVQIFDSGRIGGVAFIAMELVEGMDLRHLMDQSRPIPEEIVVLLLRDVAAGLEHAHGRCLVHRDIKPANLMLTSDGQVKIMDFGLARRDEDPSNMTVTGTVMGTPAYMSPEQAEGKEVGVESDLFSLGVVGYELLAGRRPFGGNSYAAALRSIVSDAAPRLEELPDAHSPALIRLVHGLLEKEPGLRKSAGEARETLESIADSMGIRRGADLLRRFLADPAACRSSLAALRPAPERTVPVDAGDPSPTVVLQKTPRDRIGRESTGGEGATASAGATPDTPPPPDAPPRPRRSRRGILLGVAAGLALAIAVIAIVASRMGHHPGLSQSSERALTSNSGAGSPSATGTIPAQTPGGTGSASDHAAAGAPRGGGEDLAKSSIPAPPGTPGQSSVPGGSPDQPPGPVHAKPIEDSGGTQAPGGGTSAGGGVRADRGGATQDRKLYRVSSKPYADIFVDGSPIEWQSQVSLSPGAHTFRAVNASQGLSTECTYTVKTEDPNSVLVIDLVSGTIKGRPKE
jgi:serine/threonine-protein kinase